MTHSNKVLAALAIATLFPIACAAQNPGIKIASHRGFWKSTEAQGAQNSIASLKAAQEHNLWGSEFDVHLTSDDVVIVNHDNSIQGRNISNTPYSELKDHKLANGETLSTIDEYLIQGAKCASTMLVLEIKPQKDVARNILLTDICIQKLKDHGLYNPKRVMFISFSYDICKHVAKTSPEFTNQYLNGDKDPDALAAEGINGLDYHYSIFYKHPEWVKRAHELGMSVNAWTVNKKADMEKIIALGVDCITTDEPLQLREVLGEMEVRQAVESKPEPKACAKAK